jgi:hypothetical protein
MSSVFSASAHTVNAHATTSSEISSRATPVNTTTRLAINSAATLPATDIRPAARFNSIALDPREEFEPANDPDIQVGQSNVFRFPRVPRERPVDKRQLKLQADIKRMTQSIGSAFIEAELGIRPFAQLASWLEHELFHKLQPRVHYQAHGHYQAARRGEPDSRKVPSIKTIGVRAAMQRNGEWESSMTIRIGNRARAIAMRLQLHRDRWRVIALEVG